MPYSLRVKYYYRLEETTGFSDEGYLAYDYLKSFETERTISVWGGKRVYNIVPYLFPLSSMTEEQVNELFSIFELDETLEDDYIKVNEVTGITFLLRNGFDVEEHLEKLIGWLNKYHFDWRGLITKGLAIDATGLNIY